MLAHLADISIRSLLVACIAAATLWIFQRRRTAALQHAVWTMVVAGMLALFAFGQALPRLPLRILEQPPALPQSLASAGAVEPLPLQSIPSTPVSQPRRLDWQNVAVYSYLAVAFAFLAQFVTGMFLVRKLLVAATPVRRDNVYESKAVAVPVTVGWLHPKILLPLEWREWSAAKLDAVVAHETAHARRHDGLIAAISGVNRCLFWFHPLAWILERKLALLAEQACDEACVAQLGNREVYANILLEMARMVDVSHGRLRRHALTMATGSHLKQRIDALLQDGRTFSRGLTWTGWTAVMLCGIPLVFGAGALQLDRKHAAPPPVKIAQAQTAPTPTSLPPAPVPQFDSVSIKPCERGDGAGRSGRGGAGGRGIGPSPPGEIFVNCMTIWELTTGSITRSAPLLNDHGGPFEPQRMRGGPAWIYTDYYTIDAKSSDPIANVPGPGGYANFKLLGGPMLLALITDRFHLKYHRAIEEVPVYSLVVASGGFKLQPTPDGTCIPHEPSQPLRMPLPPGQKPYCITHTGWDGPNWNMDADGQALKFLAGALNGAVMDRPVIDKTGIAGAYSFHLVFAHDATTPGDFPPGMNPFANSPTGTPVAPPLTTVLEQQLGLTLVPDKGPHEYIQLDSAERPSI